MYKYLYTTDPLYASHVSYTPLEEKCLLDDECVQWPRRLFLGAGRWKKVVLTERLILHEETLNHSTVIIFLRFSKLASFF